MGRETLGDSQTDRWGASGRSCEGKKGPSSQGKTCPQLGAPRDGLPGNPGLASGYYYNSNELDFLLK